MPVPTQQASGVGYFVSTTVDDFVFIGGIMVTDSHGLPIEFRYTEPVKANRLQRVLYGDVLERFIHSDVILANLLEQLEQQPTLIIVSDFSFATAVKDNGRIGVWLGETRLPRLPAAGDTQDVSPEEFLLQLGSAGAPTRVKVAGAESESSLRSTISKTLTDLSNTMDILEPLRRIETAIELIWEDSPDNCLQPMIAAG